MEFSLVLLPTLSSILLDFGLFPWSLLCSGNHLRRANLPFIAFHGYKHRSRNLILRV
jgi:hypothetical protein